MAAFELGGTLAHAIPELAVGPWRTAPGLASFDAEPSIPESLWRVDLTRDPAASRVALLGGERSVAHTHAVLDDAPARLEHAVAHALAEHQRACQPEPMQTYHTFSPQLSTAESSLVAALVEATVPRSSPGSLAWSAGPSGVPESPHEPGWLERALAQITDLTRGRARIETRIEGILVAHSIMTLSGDTQLWIGPRLSPIEAMLHARSVAIAVRSRHAWARILTLIVRGGGHLATLGIAGIGPAALPLVWRIVRDLLREIRHHSAGGPSAA